MNATCSATHRLTTRSWGTATEFGHKPCGAPATKVRQVKQAHGSYYWPAYFCDEHARPTDETIAAEELEENVEEPAAVEVEAPATSCPALATPGNIHFMTAHCVECNAFRMAKMNADTVEGWYRSGHFSQAEFEAYMYLWATTTAHHSAGGWVEEPTDPEVITIVAAIRRHADLPTPATLAA